MTISIANATTLGAQLLAAAGVREPRMEAGSLLAHVLGRDRTFIIAHAEDTLTDEQMGSFRGFVGQRAQGEPLQYITGRQEFFKLEFEVTPRSEEHTSELQSRFDLVCRLLLEKKKEIFSGLSLPISIT